MKSIIYQCGSEKKPNLRNCALKRRFDLLLPSFFILIILLICFDYYCYQCGCK